MEAQRFNEAIPLPEQQLVREDCIQLRQLVRVAACSVLRVHQRLKTATSQLLRLRLCLCLCPRLRILPLRAAW